MEEFMKIEGFENYSVSNYGNIRNNKTGRILKPGLNSDGYHMVQLGSKNNKYIHRLVASAFCENENLYHQVDHIDQNKTNNYYQNLRWVTQDQNIRNCKKREGCLSRYLGVTFNNNAKKWQSQIQINSKIKYLGLYNTELQAHEAFCKAVYDNNLAEFYPVNELHFRN